jgi:hypothetical protein
MANATGFFNGISRDVAGVLNIQFLYNTSDLSYQHIRP